MVELTRVVLALALTAAISGCGLTREQNGETVPEPITPVIAENRADRKTEPPVTSSVPP